MAEHTKDHIKLMTRVELVYVLRQAADFEKRNVGITWEHGTDLVNICALHGACLADALEFQGL